MTNWEDVARKLAYEAGVRALEAAALRSELEASRKYAQELEQNLAEHLLKETTESTAEPS